QWRALADRRFGIGADQILVVEKARVPDADFRYRIYNADGGEVEQCGNGARAFVKFVTDNALTDKRRIRVETLAGIIEPQLEDDGRITVDMGAPILEPARIPSDAQGLDSIAQGRDTLWPLEVAGRTVPVSVVSMGNPHAVQVVEEADTAPVATEGPQIENHARFPRRVNASFMQVLDRHHIRLRVYERGAGETLACGTGACAAVVAGIRRGLLDSPVRVHTHGGTLQVSWNNGLLTMAGPATTVFTGSVDIDELVRQNEARHAA